MIPPLFRYPHFPIDSLVQWFLTVFLEMFKSLISKAAPSKGCISQPHTLLKLSHFRKATIIKFTVSPHEA